MSAKNNLSIHHIGFAVSSPKEARIAFEALGAKFFREASVTDWNLDFQFATIIGGELELISPKNPAFPCAVSKIIEKQPCTPYHICLETDDLEAEIQRLKPLGFKQIQTIRTTDVHGYKTNGTFLFSKAAGLVEILQRCKTDE